MNRLTDKYIKIINKICSCPICNSKIVASKDKIVCTSCNAHFQVKYGVPILINPNIKESTHHSYKEFTIGKNYLAKNKYNVNKVIANYTASTNGNLYKDKEIKVIIIPNIDLQITTRKKILLDIGCGWGRWCFAAAKKKYTSIGIDTNLELLIAAKEYAEDNNIDAVFIYADALNLPFKRNIFDIIFSFSVLQHFPKKDFFSVLSKTNKFLKKKGLFRFQIMNFFGIMCLYRNFIYRKKAQKYFYPEYYSINEITNFSKKYYSKITSENCSFFTQARFTDFSIFTTKEKIIMCFVFLINAFAKILPFMKFFADNIYINLYKK